MDEKHSNSKAFQTHIPHFPDSPRRNTDIKKSLFARIGQRDSFFA